MEDGGAVPARERIKAVSSNSQFLRVSEDRSKAHTLSKGNFSNDGNIWYMSCAVW
jgi:hypothetical protein